MVKMQVPLLLLIGILGLRMFDEGRDRRVDRLHCNASPPADASVTGISFVAAQAQLRMPNVPVLSILAILDASLGRLVSLGLRAMILVASLCAYMLVGLASPPISDS